MSESYWNEEDDEDIICPYCRKHYEPSYEDCSIGGQIVNCYDEGTEYTLKCDGCGKKFTMMAYQPSWKYETETIDGEATEEEAEEKEWT